MQSFKSAAAAAAPPPSLPHPEMYCHSPFYLRGGAGEDISSRNQTRFVDLEELHNQTTLAFHHDDAVDLSPSSIFSLKSSIVHNNLPYVTSLNTSVGSVVELTTAGTGPGAGGCLDTEQYMYQKGTTFGSSLGSGHSIENWGDSGMADNSQHTDTSTDVDTDDKNQVHGIQHDSTLVVDSMHQSKSKSGDQKTLRRLAQNREAARKSRLRKKAYVQQLESSRLRLMQLEQELQRARQQGFFVASGFLGDQSHSGSGTEALAFDMEYARWIDEHQRLINDLRSAVNSQMVDNELRL